MRDGRHRQLATTASTKDQLRIQSLLAAKEPATPSLPTATTHQDALLHHRRAGLAGPRPPTGRHRRGAARRTAQLTQTRQGEAADGGVAARQGGFWAENNPTYQRCAREAAQPECVKAVFHLQGSEGELRRSCASGDLRRNSAIRLLPSYFPASIFPKGSQCESRNARPGSMTIIEMTPRQFRPVCECVERS